MICLMLEGIIQIQKRVRPSPRSHQKIEEGVRFREVRLAGHVDLVPADVDLNPRGALKLLHLRQRLYSGEVPTVGALLQAGHLADERGEVALAL
jgi:hypothetical protein